MKRCVNDTVNGFGILPNTRLDLTAEAGVTQEKAQKSFGSMPLFCCKLKLIRDIQEQNQCAFHLD